MKPVTLRGIKIFGFGSIVPMELITKTRERRKSGEVDYDHNGINTPMNNEPTDDYQDIMSQMSQVSQMSQMNEMGVGGDDYDIGSPTRINSSNNIMTLDKFMDENKTSKIASHKYNNKEQGSTIGNNISAGNGLLFSQALIGEIVTKVEFGRVVMGVDHI